VDANVVDANVVDANVVDANVVDAKFASTTMMHIFTNNVGRLAVAGIRLFESSLVFYNHL
jgi:hypothetical protein